MTEPPKIRQQTKDEFIKFLQNEGKELRLWQAMMAFTGSRILINHIEDMYDDNKWIDPYGIEGKR